MLVPPMSKRPRRRSRTRPRPRPRRARRPPGPRAARDAAASAAVGDRDEPAGRRHHEHLGARARASRARYGAAHRLAGTRSTTVVTMRSYSRNSGDTSCEHGDVEARARAAPPATARSCRGFEVGVQQAHRDRVDAVGKRRARAPSNGSISPPRASSRPADLEAQRARHERRGPVDERVVQRRADLARDLDHVGEAARRDERDARAAPLEERVGRDRRAVREHVGDGRAAEPRRSPARTARAGIVRRRRHLGDPPVVGDDVGERPTGVDPRAARAERLSPRSRLSASWPFAVRLGRAWSR